jgi:hypothetical protein
MELKSY